MVATLSSTTNAISDIWNCEDGFGVTAGLAAGSYTVSVDAMNNAGAAVGVAPALTEREIMPLNKVTHLGTVTIPIDGR